MVDQSIPATARRGHVRSLLVLVGLLCPVGVVPFLVAVVFRVRVVRSILAIARRVRVPVVVRLIRATRRRGHKYRLDKVGAQ